MIDALKYCALCIQIVKKNDLPEEWKKVWDTFLDLHSNKHKQKQKNSWIRKMGLLNLDFGYVLPYCELTFWQRYNCRVSNYHIFPPRNLNLVSVLRKMYCGDCRRFPDAKIFFENDGIRKKNATDELYSSSKWPFEQADMNINWILVYWDDGNSLPNILVIPFKDGVTFVVMTAIQSLQWCNLESVADVKFVTVTKCHFWSKFSKWPLRTAIKLISCIFFS